MPNQWSPLGAPALGNRTPSAEAWANPYGAIHGAKMARITKNAVMTMPITSIQRASPTVSVKGLASPRSTARISTSLGGR